MRLTIAAFVLIGLATLASAQCPGGVCPARPRPVVVVPAVPAIVIVPRPAPVVVVPQYRWTRRGYVIVR